MAYYDTNNPVFVPFVRRLEANDLAHAEVLNQTIFQCVSNENALKNASSRMYHVVITPDMWMDMRVRIGNSHINATSLIDIYYAQSSEEDVIDANIKGSQESGALILTCSSVPKTDIVIDCIEVRNEVVENANPVEYW